MTRDEEITKLFIEKVIKFKECIKGEFFTLYKEFIEHVADTVTMMVNEEDNVGLEELEKSHARAVVNEINLILEEFIEHEKTKPLPDEDISFNLNIFKMDRDKREIH